MEAYFYAFWVFFTYNPYGEEPYMVPIDYTVAAWEEAAKYPNVDPADVLAMLIAEHGGTHPYPADSLGKDGEVGLMQLMKGELNRFNRCGKLTVEKIEEDPEEHDDCGYIDPHDSPKYTMDDLYDPYIAIEVAAFSIHHMKYRHGTKHRCTKKVKECKTVRKEAENGGTYLTTECEMRKQEHNWIAHYRCSPSFREEKGTDGKLACKTTYRERLIKRFSLENWKDSAVYAAYEESQDASDRRFFFLAVLGLSTDPSDWALSSSSEGSSASSSSSESSSSSSSSSTSSGSSGASSASSSSISSSASAAVLSTIEALASIEVGSSAEAVD